MRKRTRMHSEESFRTIGKGFVAAFAARSQPILRGARRSHGDGQIPPAHCAPEREVLNLAAEGAIGNQVPCPVQKVSQSSVRSDGSLSWIVYRPLAVERSRVGRRSMRVQKQTVARPFYFLRDAHNRCKTEGRQEDECGAAPRRRPGAGNVIRRLKAKVPCGRIQFCRGRNPLV